jgi:heme-degrading monooxygenase HmoA
MYARIATFEGMDPARADEAQRILREEFLPRLKELAGYSGWVTLADRGAGRGIGVTLFDTEENLREGDRFLDEMTPPDELQPVSRTSVEHYEVLFHEGGTDAKAARLSRLEGPPEGIDEGMRHALDNILPRARQVDGWRGILSLGDRSSGREVLLTFWDSSESMRASEEQANALRKESAGAARQTISGVERYEVVTAEIPVASTA